MIKINYPFIVLVVFIFFTTASADENTAKEHYSRGLKLFNQAKNARNFEERKALYEKSKDHFTISFNEWKHPQTSYFLSIVSSKLKDYDSTIKYAQLARGLHPPKIDKKYLHSISNLLEWAKARKKLKEEADRLGVSGVAYINIYDPEVVVPGEL